MVGRLQLIAQPAVEPLLEAQRQVHAGFDPVEARLAEEGVEVGRYHDYE